MNTPTPTPTYAGYRFPAEIISHAVWMYFRFLLSYRDVEELLAERGIVVTYESVRQWCRKFGQPYANQLRRWRARTGDKGYLDEVFLTINGKQHYLWRAVDQHGNVLDILLQSRRNKRVEPLFCNHADTVLRETPKVRSRPRADLSAPDMPVTSPHAVQEHSHWVRVIHDSAD